MIKYYKGQHIIHLTDAVLEQHQRQSQKQRITIDPSKLKWKPYVVHIHIHILIRPAPGMVNKLTKNLDPSLVEHNWLSVFNRNSYSSTYTRISVPSFLGIAAPDIPDVSDASGNYHNVSFLS